MQINSIHVQPAFKGIYVDNFSETHSELTLKLIDDNKGNDFTMFSRFTDNKDTVTLQLPDNRTTWITISDGENPTLHKINYDKGGWIPANAAINTKEKNMSPHSFKQLVKLVEFIESSPHGVIEKAKKIYLNHFKWLTQINDSPYELPQK